MENTYNGEYIHQAQIMDIKGNSYIDWNLQQIPMLLGNAKFDRYRVWQNNRWKDRPVHQKMRSEHNSKAESITFTFMHLADAFIQSNLHCILGPHFTFCQFLLSLGIEPMTLALLVPHSTV